MEKHLENGWFFKKAFHWVEILGLSGIYNWGGYRWIG